MLSAQYGLVIWVNLYVSVPAADRGAGFATRSAPLAVQAALGLLLVVTGIGVPVRAILARRRAVIVISAVGLVAIIGAASGGAAFVGNGKDGASFAMVLLTVLAMLSYLVGLSSWDAARGPPGSGGQVLPDAGPRAHPPGARRGGQGRHDLHLHHRRHRACDRTAASRAGDRSTSWAAPA